LDELNLNSRQEAIHNKGFDLFDFGYTMPEATSNNVTEYNKIKIGVK